MPDFVKRLKDHLSRSRSRSRMPTYSESVQTRDTPVTPLRPRSPAPVDTPLDISNHVLSNAPTSPAINRATEQGRVTRSPDYTKPLSSIHQSGDYASITVQGPYNDVGRDQHITYIGASPQIIEQGMERIAGAHALSQHLRSLPRADSAAWNSYTNAVRPTCFEGTRATVLNRIYTWIASPEGNEPQIYVLDGLAGIGKSTVARTVAEEAHERGWLGASFFFSRHEDERNSGQLFFATIAFQLSVYRRDYSRSIGEALESNPNAARKQLQDQLRELITQPLTNCTHPSTILIVVDALDECKEQDAKLLLSLFLQEIRKLPKFKVLLTTRPERYILHTLLRHNVHQLYRLHDIEDSIVEGDVRSYLNHGLSSQAVEEALPELEPPPWTPTLSDIEILVNAAGKLFIIASTAIKFLLDDKRCDPKAQMADLIRGIAIDSTGSNPVNKLDEIYIQILRAAIPLHPPNILTRFHSVVGAIVVLEDPLSLRSLASLLHVDYGEAISALVHLQSIISLSGQDKTPRIYHKSFPDFITDAARCSNDLRFHISVGTQHGRIAQNCFRVMEKQLRPNICALQFPEKYSENDKIRHLCDGRISSELQYACIHWATHLFSAVEDDYLYTLLEHFSFTHILHWLEVLSLIGRLEVACTALDQAMKFVGIRVNAERVKEILNDAYRLLSQFYDIIESSALQIYYSALNFTPHGTPLYQTYAKEFPNRLIATNGVQEHWSPLVAVLRGHIGAISSLSFSPNGSRLASGSSDNTVRLWDGGTGVPIATLQAHAETVLSVSFSPDGSRLASGSKDSTVRLWDGSTGVPIATLEGHASDVSSLSFSPNGSRLASGSDDATVRLWDGGTGVPIATLEGHSDTVLCIAFSPDSLRLASGSYDATVILWDGATGVLIATLEGHLDTILSLLFSPDSSKLASGSDDTTVIMWDGATGAPINVLAGHTSAVWSLSFSPDGSRFATGSQDNTVRLWDGVTELPIAVLDLHSSAVSSVSFSPDGLRLASGSHDATVRLWDSSTGVPVTALEGHASAVSTLSFSPTGSRLASGSDDATVRLWDGTAESPIAALQGHSDIVHSLLFSSYSSQLASESENAKVTRWDGATVPIAHLDTVSSLSFSPDGSRLASGSHDATVRLWNGSTGVAIAILRGHSRSVHAVTFSPDGSRLASGSRDNTVRLWDGGTGAPIATLKGHSRSVQSLSFSPDGSRLASGSGDNTVRLWECDTGVPIATLQGHSYAVGSVSFSPDGSRLASGSHDATVRLWDGGTGSLVTILKGHSRPVDAISFSPDGSQLVSGSRDNTTRLWDSGTGGSLGTLNVKPDWCSSSTVLCGISISLGTDKSADTFRRYYIQGTVPNSDDLVPLLWLPLDTAEISCSAFCGDSAAFGCNDGRVISLNLSQLNLQETAVA